MKLNRLSLVCIAKRKCENYFRLLSFVVQCTERPKKLCLNTILSKFNKKKLNIRKLKRTFFANRIHEGVALRPISEPKNIETVMARYSPANEAIRHGLPLLVKYNKNIAAFTEDGTLVAWTFR